MDRRIHLHVVSDDAGAVERWACRERGHERAAGVDRPVPQRDPSVTANVVSSNPDGAAPYTEREDDSLPCPNCGYLVRPAAYCRQCGEELGDDRGFDGGVSLGLSSGIKDAYEAGPDSTVQCPSCSQMNKGDNVFCINCGRAGALSAVSASG